MNKAEFIEITAEKLGISKNEAEKNLDAMLETTIETLIKGDVVKLPGLGVLQVKVRAARKGVIPGSGTPIEIPAKKVVAFRISKTLKERL